VTQPVDTYTFGHGLVGVLLGMWRMPWYGALGTSIAFELFENFVLKPGLPQMFPVGTRDTLVNSALDTTAWMAGYGFGRLIPGPTPKMWASPLSRDVRGLAFRGRRSGSRRARTKDNGGMAERGPAPRRTSHVVVPPSPPARHGRNSRPSRPGNTSTL